MSSPLRAGRRLMLTRIQAFEELGSNLELSELQEKTVAT
jgi:hypothetical protein